MGNGLWVGSNCEISLLMKHYAIVSLKFAFVSRFYEPSVP